MFGGILPGSFLLWSILLENYLGSILLKSIQRKSSLRVVGIIPGFFLLESIHLEKNQLASIQVKSIHFLWVFSIAINLEGFKSKVFTCCGYSQLQPDLSQEGVHRLLSPAQHHLVMMNNVNGGGIK